MEHSLSSTSRAETERYKSIIQAAERLFVEKGYHAVSVEQIADAAGVSKGLVHYHFSSKEHLLVCILEDMLRSLFSSLDVIVKREEPAQKKIRLAIEVYLRMANSRAGLARIAFFEEALTEDAKNYLITLAEENVLKLAGLVEDGISKGELKAVNSRLVANLITGVIFEVMREVMIQKRDFKTNELASEITEILCNGIKS